LNTSPMVQIGSPIKFHTLPNSRDLMSQLDPISEKIVHSLEDVVETWNTN
jgi:hypothetical protein